MGDVYIGVLAYVAGMVALFLELFIPSGGILGIVGVLASVYGIYEIMAWQPWVGILVILATVAYLYAIIRLWSKRVKMTASLGGSDSTTPEASPVEIIGKEGETVTTLRPAGFAVVDNRRFQVVTVGAFIPKGVKVRVLGVTGNRILVDRVEAPANDDGEEAL